MRHVSSIQGLCMLGAIALLPLASTGCLRDVGLGDDGAGPSAGSGTVTEGTGGCGPLSTGPGMFVNNCTGSAVSTGSGVIGGMTTGVGGGPVGMSTGTGMMGGTGGAHGGSSAVSTGSGVMTGTGGSSFGVSTGSGVMTGTGGSSFGVSTGSGVMTGTGGGSFGSSTSGGMTSSTSGGMTSSTSGGPAPACGLGPTPIPCDFSHLNADCAPYGAVCDYVFSQCSCCFVHDDLTCAQDADCQSSFGADAYCSSGTCGCK